MSKSAKKSSRTRRRPSSTATHPWIIGGIDYGPAIVAFGDLTAWALDLAAKEVDDWPEGRRHVRSVRRYLLARLRGRHIGTPAFEDVLFTARLLARIFEADLGLSMSDMVTILDEIGLPTDVVPLSLKRQGMTRLPLRPPVAPVVQLRPRPACAGPAPEPCSECGCSCDGCFHGFRNAA